MCLTARGALASAVLSWISLSASPLTTDNQQVGLEVVFSLARQATSTPVVTLRAEALRHGSASEEPEAVTREWRIEVPWQGRLELDRDLTWRLTLTADGYWASPVQIEPESSAKLVRMILIPTGRLAGRALLPDGQSLPATLNLLLESVPLAARGQAQASPAGRSRFVCPIGEDGWHCIVPSGRWDLRLAADGYVPHYRWNVEIAIDQEASLGELGFRKGASLVGWVEAEGAEPDPSPAVVELKPQVIGSQDSSVERRRISTLGARVTADERGFFQFEALAAGSYTLNVSKLGFAPERLHSIVVAEGVELRLDSPVVLYPPAVLEAFLEPPADPSGQPWEVALIRSQPNSRVAVTLEKSSASLEGHWRRGDLQRGSYRLHVRDARGSSWLARKIEVEPVMSPLFLEIDALPIRGSVSMGDEALKTTIVFGTVDRRPNVYITSDDDGRFEGHLPRGGTWQIDLVDEEFQAARRIGPVEVHRRPGATYAEVDLSLPDTRLTGKVVQEGKPVADAFVIVTTRGDDGTESSARREKSANYRTNSEGKFEIRGISPGEHDVSAYLGRLDPVSDWVRIDLQEGLSPHVRLELKSKVELAGQVVSSSGGVPGASVIANPVGVGGWPSKTVTSADGTFTLKLSANTSAVDLMLLAAGIGFDFQRVAVDHGRKSPLVIPVEAGGGSLIVSDRRILNHTLHRRGGAVPLSKLWSILGKDRFVANLAPAGGFAFLKFAPGEYALCPGTQLREDLCTFGELAHAGELILKKP